MKKRLKEQLQRKPKKKGAIGFGQEYWAQNYEVPEEMDGIGNASEHVLYIKSVFGLEYIDISSIIDFGFGLGHLFEALLSEFKPYKAWGIEPSSYAFEKVAARNISPTPSTKFKLENIDLLTWCRASQKVKCFDLGVCTSVLQYLTRQELEEVIPIISSRVKYLYLSVPTDKELDRQIEDLDFLDEYAVRRSRLYYQKLLRKNFTFVSSRLLESKNFFNEENTFFTDVLFRF